MNVMTTTVSGSANQVSAEMKFGDKPAFVSWWDYGFQALNTGEHPSVSDNFQTGIPASGNMLLARAKPTWLLCSFNTLLLRTSLTT